MRGQASIWAISAALVATPAIAQTGGVAQTAEAPTGGLEEIVVTAQRTAQNLQDVPLSVTAVTAERLLDNNVTTLDRLSFVTPGLNIVRMGQDLRPSSRGATTEQVGANADPTFGLFVDGVYQSRTSQGSLGFVDIARIEVLKGPQGTLYGRNTFGGAINIFSNDPAPTLGAGLNLLYGRFNRARAEGFVNLPVNDRIAVRVAGAYERMDGFIINTSTGNNQGDEDVWFVRPSIRFQITDNLDLTVKYSYYRQGGAGLSPFGYKTIGSLVDPSIVSLTNRGTSILGNPFPLNFRVRDSIPDINGIDVGSPIELSPYRINQDANARRKQYQHLVSAILNWDLGGAVLRSITGYNKFYSLRGIDTDFSPFPVAYDLNITEDKAFSQEVQLTSPAGQRFQWVVGAFYFNDDIFEVFFQDQNPNFGGLSTPARPGASPSSAPFDPNRPDGISPVYLRTNAYAAFAQATIPLGERFSITGGIRYSEDRKRYSNQAALPGQLTLADIPRLPFAQRDTLGVFDKVTYRIGAEFKPSPAHLIYASHSTGFTSGGFNAGVQVVNGQTVPNPGFAPQEVKAYEVGTKNRFAEGRVQFNGALFYNDFSGLQVSTQVPFGFTVLTLTANAARARSYGGEFEFLANPIDPLTIGINYALNNTRYNEYIRNNPFGAPVLACPAPPVSIRGRNQLVCVRNPDGTFRTGVDNRGNRLPNSPVHVVTIFGDYRIETSAGTITPGFNVYFSSGYFGSDLNTPIGRQPAYTKTDLRLGWESLDKRLTLQAFVENLEDNAILDREVFGPNGSINGMYQMPRTWGVRAGVRF